MRITPIPKRRLRVISMSKKTCIMATPGLYATATKLARNRKTDIWV